MQIGLCLATEKGYYSLLRLIESGFSSDIAWVSTFKEINVEKSWDEDIRRLCITENIRIINHKELALVETGNAIITIGWKFLISEEVYNKTEYGLIIFHDSLLPKYRGFTPTVTAMLCGEKKVGVSALFGNNRVDSGDIIFQRNVDIKDSDYISDVIEKEKTIYAEFMIDIFKGIKNKNLPRIPQNEEEATYSIWRNVEDCHIDWTWDAEFIERFVRAVHLPYPGAYTIMNGTKIIIDRVEILEDMKFEMRIPGRIWMIENNYPSIICGKGMIKIIKAHYPSGGMTEFKSLRVQLV